MEIDIVVYGPHGRHVLGRPDVPAAAWVDGMPPKVWEDLSVGLFTEQLELVLHRKRSDAVAKHKLRLLASTREDYYFQCLHCEKQTFFPKSWLGFAMLDNPHKTYMFVDVEKDLGGCPVLSTKQGKENGGIQRLGPDS